MVGLRVKQVRWIVEGGSISTGNHFQRCKSCEAGTTVGLTLGINGRRKVSSKFPIHETITDKTHFETIRSVSISKEAFINTTIADVSLKVSTMDLGIPDLPVSIFDTMAGKIAEIFTKRQ